MAKNYAVARIEALRMFEHYTDKTAWQVLANAKVKLKSDAVKCILRHLKASVVAVSHEIDVIPEVDLGQIRQHNNDGFYKFLYVKNRIKAVNDCLRTMSLPVSLGEKAGDFLNSYIQIEAIEKGEIGRFYWMPYLDRVPAPIDQAGGRRVVVLGRLLRTSFSTDLMRGARAMARELGAVLIDRRTKDDADGMKRHVQDLASNGDRECDAIIFYFVQATRDNSGIIDRLSEFATIHAGLDRPDSISIDYAKSAQLIVAHLRNRCMADGTKPGSVVLPVFDGLDGSHPIEVRQGIYRDRIEEGGHFEVHLLPLKYQFDNDSTDDAGFKAIDDVVEQDSDRKIVAILGRSHQITLGAIRSVMKHNRGPSSTVPIRVFGENIATDLLFSLNDPSDPLEAICSADPYYMGRYIVRAALNEVHRSRESNPILHYPKVNPIIITKSQTQLNESYCTIDRLPDVLVSEDIMLDGKDFAWQEWMRDHCRFGYGPLRDALDREGRPSRH